MGVMPLWLERLPPKPFEEALQELRQAGFIVKERPDGTALVLRGRCAALVGRDSERRPRLERAGWVLPSNELAVLVDLGYQKCWQAPSGHREPAQAEQVQQLHQFTLDLRERLGLPALFNQSLGSVNHFHNYDQLHRPAGVPRLPEL